MQKIGLLVFSLFFFGSITSLGQTLSGRITAKSGEGVAGANIRVLNTGLGASSDPTGNFSIANLPVGRFTVAVSAVGFASQTLSVLVGESGDKPLNINLAEAANALDEVVVSAEKTEAQARRVPLSLSTFSAKQVADYRLWSLKDLTGLIPNFYSDNPGDDKNVMSIRGITSASFDQPIAVYLDGVNQFRLSTAIPQLTDIERIEILRGPQGTLYGRNAMGGVINIITRQPTNQTTGYAEASAASFGIQRYAVGLKTPLVRGKLFLGASLLTDIRRGYFINKFDNSNFDRYQSLTGNYSLRWLASPRFSATVNVKHFNRENRGSYPLVPFASAFVDSLRYRVNLNAVAADVDNTLFASATLNYYGHGVDVTAISGYQQSKRYYNGPIDADVQLPFAAQSFDVNSIVIRPDNGQNKFQSFSQEIRASSSAQSVSAFKWTAGLYLFNNRYPTTQSLVVGADGAKFGQPGGPYSAVTTSLADGSGYALFGQGSYQLAPQLTLTAGLRYDNERQTLTVGSQFVKGAFVQTTRKDTSATTQFSALQPKATLAYQPAENQLLYGTYSRGYRVGGLSQIGFDPSEVPLVAFRPEFSNNYEVGYKSTFLNNRLRANLALFYITVADAQVPTLVPSLGFRTATTNAGNFSSKGVELELSATPVRGLQIDWNTGIVNARYSTLSVPVTVFENGKPQKVSRDFAGNRQIQTPSYTSLLAVQYSRPVGKQTALSRQLSAIVRAEYKAIGQQYFDLPNRYSQDAYSLINLKAGVSARYWSLMVWGRNVGQTTYIGYGYNFGAVTLGAPRTWGVTLAGRF
jgi:iron complex outermembrane recepter protein